MCHINCTTSTVEVDGKEKAYSIIHDASQLTALYGIVHHINTKAPTTGHKIQVEEYLIWIPSLKTMVLYKVQSPYTKL